MENNLIYIELDRLHLETAHSLERFIFKQSFMQLMKVKTILKYTTLGNTIFSVD